HVHALDISAEMLRIAKQKQDAQGVTNVTFCEGKLDEAPLYPREHFDSVWAYSLLHLVSDRRRLLTAVFGLLKPGGSFISSNVCLGGTGVPYRPMITLLRWFGKAPLVYIYDRATLIRELAEAGFVEIEERDVGAENTVAFV